MSGIAGIFSRADHPVEPEQLARMLASIAHRGPDGSGTWHQGRVGLGHRMLWTTPESLREQLPFVNEARNLVITADARLDNRDELLATLGITHRPRADVSDGELILRAYEKWGESCPERLVGDFAFVLWDKRKQLLFCARDHLGIKPFYYYLSGRTFAFASELKALLCLPEVPRRLNETRVADYLLGIWEDTAITFYQDIVRLPPAHHMVVEAGKARVRQYWRLDPRIEVRLGSDTEYAEAWGELFREAVRCRLRSAFPVGSMLSGGLDSSSVVCMARELLSQAKGSRLHTFSVVFDGRPEFDDNPYIQDVLAQGGLEPHVLEADHLRQFANLEQIFRHQDEAFWLTGIYWMWELFATARRQGVRVCLDGLEGDVVTWYSPIAFAELARSGRWIRLGSEMLSFSSRYKAPLRSLIMPYVISPLFPEPIRRAWRYLRWGNRMGRWAVNPLIRAEFARWIDLEARAHALLGERGSPARTAKEDHWRLITGGDTPYNFEIIERAAAAFGIETRHPLWDRRLIEFSYGLPAEQKLSRGWNRIVVRRAMAGILPEKVRWRGGKADFVSTLTRDLLDNERELLQRLLIDDTGIIGDYVDRTALGEVFRRYVSSNGLDEARDVWKTAVLSMWLRHTGLTAHAKERDDEEGTMNAENQPAPGKDEMNRQQAAPPVGRKPYQTPELAIYGSVEQLTASGGGGAVDGSKSMAT